MSEDYWKLAEETAEQIKKWPEWKRNISLLDEKEGIPEPEHDCY